MVDPGGGNNFRGREVTSFAADYVRGSHWLSGRVPTERYRHGHTHPHILLVTGGTYISALATGGRFVSPLMFCPGETEHDDHVSDEGGSFYTFTFFDERLLETLDRPLPPDPSLICDETIIHIARRLVRQSNEIRDTQWLEFLCLELVGALASASSDRIKPRWLKRAMDCVIEMPHLSIGALAESCDVHPVYLARTFRKFVGASPAQFRESLRLTAAADELRQTATPISDIALAQGFADQSHFTKSFKRFYGVSPGRYRAVQ